MVRINKVYTKGGDKGQTSLVGGARVDKDDLRLEAYGTVDEMNASVGLARTFLTRGRAEGAAEDVVTRLDTELKRIQNQLFDLGSDLATRTEDRFEGQPLIEEGDILYLEALIDELNGELPELRSFVLPGGGPVNAFLHQARTICRRAERRVQALRRREPIGEWVIPYVNRLSDTFFVLSRWAAKRLDEPEFLWESIAGGK